MNLFILEDTIIFVFAYQTQVCISFENSVLKSKAQRVQTEIFAIRITGYQKYNESLLLQNYQSTSK